MFDIGWSELVIIGIVALIVIGPKELPTVLRALGQWMGKIRRMASDFQGQFQEAMREAEVADLKKQFDDAASAAQFGVGDPLESARQQLQGAIEDQPASAASSGEEPKSKPDEPAPQPPVPEASAEAAETAEAAQAAAERKESGAA